MSITFLAMVVVGGLGSVMGSIAGAALMTFLDIKLQAIQDIPAIGPALVTFSEKYMSVAGISNVAVIVYGLIMILIVLFEPLGYLDSGFETNVTGRHGRFKRIQEGQKTQRMPREERTQKGYRKLIVWEKAHNFVLEIYRTTFKLPK